jgi:hypothetical protein
MKHVYVFPCIDRVVVTDKPKALWVSDWVVMSVYDRSNKSVGKLATVLPRHRLVLGILYSFEPHEFAEFKECSEAKAEFEISWANVGWKLTNLKTGLHTRLCEGDMHNVFPRLAKSRKHYFRRIRAKANKS